MIFAPLALSLFAVAATASPISISRRASAINDVTVAQYAIGLEFIEIEFYTQGLAQFDEATFAAAGFSPLVRTRFQQILEHEQTHAKLLASLLGSQAPQPCNYKYPFTDLKSWTALSQVFEGVGTSAYLGAAQFITDKNTLEIAGSILSTEARQAAWVAASVNADTPWSGAFDVPLDFNQVTTLASAFITSCPSTNPVLPFKPFPALTTSSMTPAAGSSVSLNYTGAANGQFLTLLTGLSAISVTISSGQATLPSNLTGTVYALVTNNSGAVSDAETIAGPAILQFPDNAV